MISSNTPGADTTAQPAASAAFSNRAQSATDTLPPDQGGKFSFNQRQVFGRTVLGRGIGSEALTKLQEILLEEYKLADPTVAVDLLVIDNANEIAHFSCVIVVLGDKAQPTLGRAAHTLIIEDTGEPVTPRSENLNGKTIELVRVSGDAYDDRLKAMVADRVRAAFPNVDILEAYAEVVPRGFDFSDRAAIRQLALNAGMACASELEVRKPNFHDLNLANHVHDSKLLVNLSFTKTQIQNAVGRPIRADVGISFSAQSTARAAAGVNQSLNSDDRASTVSRATGFIDLIYAPAAPQQASLYGAYANQTQPAYGAPQIVPTQLYSPRLVLTSLESQFASTIPSQLLSLITAEAVAADGNWMQAFRTTPHSGKRVPMHDIGAVGIESPSPGQQFGTRIDTNADSFRDEHLGQLVAAFIRPGLVISVDVPECDAETWYLNVFSAGAAGSTGALEAIYAAADQLTNNEFRKLFSPGSPIFTDAGNRVHLGYYIDENGVKRDIRDIDYLAVGNMNGDRDPKSIRDWSDTFVNGRYSLLERLHERKRIIQGLLPSAEITGFAHRVTFRHDFLNALAQAAKNAGLAMTIVTPMNTGDLNNQRGIGSFVPDAGMGLAMAPVFNQDFGIGTGNMGGGYNPYSNNRWR